MRGPALLSDKLKQEKPGMAPNTKRVFYVNNVAAPVYLDILAKRQDVQVGKLVNDAPDSQTEPVLAQAHAYQIGSLRQELAPKFQGYTPLLNRLPELAGAVDQRCRLRYRQPGRRHGGGSGGGQPGQRQQGRVWPNTSWR